MEPSLEVNGTYKPLSQCDKRETEKLIVQISEKMGQAAFLPHVTIYKQLEGFLTQAEQRMNLFDIGYLEDKASKTKIRKKITLIDDD